MMKPKTTEGDLREVASALDDDNLDFQAWIDGMDLKSLKSLTETVASNPGGNVDHNIKAYLQYYPK